MKSANRKPTHFTQQLLFIAISLCLFTTGTQAANIIGHWGSSSYRDVQVSGTTAICTAESSGIDIIDFSNPAKPVLLTNFDTDGQAVGVAISGTKAYIADSNGGLQIIDITNPAAPTLLGNFNTDISPQDIKVVGNKAYIANGRYGLKIIDVINPQTPTLLSTHQTVGDTSDLFVVGDVAYVIEENTGLEIFDVSNPAQLRTLSRISNKEATGIWVAGNIACLCIGDSGFILYNISNPASPQRLGGLDIPMKSVRRAQIVGPKLYLAAGTDGLLVVDITDPQNPTLSASHTLKGNAFNLAISGTTALIASWHGGLNLVNVANAAAPVDLGHYDHASEDASVWVEGSTAFLGTWAGGLEILNLTNPQTPVRIAHYDHPAECVQTVGNTAYICGEYMFRILNISNLNAPSEIGKCGINGRGFAMDINGNTAYVADGSGGFQIIDISDPTKPAVLSTYAPGFGAYPMGVQVVNNTAYVCCSRTGLHILDVSNPRQPQELGIYDTPGRASDVKVVGSTAYVADDSGGLLLINVTDPAKPTLLGSIEPRDQNNQINDVQSVTIIGTYAYVACKLSSTTGTFKVIDISDPAKLSVVKTVNISGMADDLMLYGNKAFITDGGRLSIINLSGTIVNHKVFFPHAACAQGWSTEIALINSSNLGVSGELSAYDDHGNQIGGKIAISLNLHGRSSVTVNDSFITSEKVSYLIFESNSPALAGYTKFQHDSIGYRGALPAVTKVDDPTLYVSHIASNPGWWTGIALLNTTDSSKTLTISFSDGQSRSIDLAAKEHKSFSIRSLFADTAQPQIESAIITNCTGVVGFELFGSNTDKQLGGISLSGKTENTLYFPHIVSDNNWWTGIAAFDPNGSNQTLTITPYAQNGDAFTDITINLVNFIDISNNLASGTKKYLTSAADIGMPAGTAWMKIQAVSQITGFELFGNNPNSWLAGYTGVGLESKKGIFAKFDQAIVFGRQKQNQPVRESANAWTGIALINSEDENGIVSLNARSDDGSLVAAIELPLNPHERIMGTPETIFSGKDLTGASYITYESDRKLVGFQINGDGKLIDALPALKY